MYLVIGRNTSWYSGDESQPSCILGYTKDEFELKAFFEFCAEQRGCSVRKTSTTTAQLQDGTILRALHLPELPTTKVGINVFKHSVVLS